MLHINLYFFHFVPRRGFHFSKQSYLVSSVWLWTLHFIFTPVWPQSSSQLKLTWNSKTYLKGMTFPLFHAILRSYQSNFILSYLNQTPINAKPKYNIIIQKPFSLSSVFLILWWDSRVHSPTLKIKVFLQEKKISPREAYFFLLEGVKQMENVSLSILLFRYRSAPFTVRNDPPWIQIWHKTPIYL